MKLFDVTFNAASDSFLVVAADESQARDLTETSLKKLASVCGPLFDRDKYLVRTLCQDTSSHWVSDPREY